MARPKPPFVGLVGAAPPQAIVRRTQASTASVRSTTAMLGFSNAPWAIPARELRCAESI